MSSKSALLLMTIDLQDGGMQKICVIGGSRYVVKLLVERLQAAGHQVTVINRGSVQPLTTSAVPTI
ncbi:hypothetical protein [Microtetraspora fusca]|uniref:hypothetical protein n=1 Tax=Microtetraspora fusca TaxID=1997 RepID=UPI001C3F3857|nr:hypothetical protein [Microtetraspora fusca]